MWIFPLAVIVIGLIVVALALGAALVGRASRSWPSVEGLVTRVRIKKIEDAETGLRYWNVTIEYQYEVEGRSYIGRGFKIGERTMRVKSRQIADELALAFANTPVAVHYDPAHPRRSAIQRGTGKLILRQLVLGLVLILVGFGWGGCVILW